MREKKVTLFVIIIESIYQPFKILGNLLTNLLFGNVTRTSLAGPLLSPVVLLDSDVAHLTWHLSINDDVA